MSMPGIGNDGHTLEENDKLAQQEHSPREDDPAGAPATGATGYKGGGTGKATGRGAAQQPGRGRT